MVLAIHGMTTRTMIFEDLLCRSSFLHKKRRERDEDSRSPTNIEIGGLYITNIIMYEKTAEETVSPFRLFVTCVEDDARYRLSVNCLFTEILYKKCFGKSTLFYYFYKNFASDIAFSHKTSYNRFRKVYFLANFG